MPVVLELSSRATFRLLREVCLLTACGGSSACLCCPCRVAKPMVESLLLRLKESAGLEGRITAEFLDEGDCVGERGVYLCKERWQGRSAQRDGAGIRSTGSCGCCFTSAVPPVPQVPGRASGWGRCCLARQTRCQSCGASTTPSGEGRLGCSVGWMPRHKPLHFCHGMSTGAQLPELTRVFSACLLQRQAADAGDQPAVADPGPGHLRWVGRLPAWQHKLAGRGDSRAGHAA